MLSVLHHRLDGVKYENGKINVVNKKTGNKPKFYQKKWCVSCDKIANDTFLNVRFSDISDIFCLYSSYLCDVTLKSEDGKEFPCHKCVLCARLGKFNKAANAQMFSFVLNGREKSYFALICFLKLNGCFENTENVLTKCSECFHLFCRIL